MGILPRPASGQAYVSLTSAMLASALYGSLTQGTGLSAADGLAAVRQGLQGPWPAAVDRRRSDLA